MFVSFVSGLLPGVKGVVGDRENFTTGASSSLALPALPEFPLLPLCVAVCACSCPIVLLQDWSCRHSNDLCIGDCRGNIGVTSTSLVRGVGA